MLVYRTQYFFYKSRWFLNTDLVKILRDILIKLLDRITEDVVNGVRIMRMIHLVYFFFSTSYVTLIFNVVLFVKKIGSKFYIIISDLIRSQ